MITKASTLKKILSFFIAITALLSCQGQIEDVNMKIDFGSKKVQNGYIAVSANDEYDSLHRYGFASDSPLKNVTRTHADPLYQDFCTSSKPFYFIVDLPEGNYEIVLLMGDSENFSTTTVKAESRRLMRELIVTNSVEFLADTLLVNVRTPRIDETQSIRLKFREYPYLNWYNKLTIEFNNT